MREELIINPHLKEFILFLLDLKQAAINDEGVLIAGTTECGRVSLVEHLSVDAQFRFTRDH